MKKFLLIVSTMFLMLIGFLTLSASAERYSQLPVTMYQERFGSESMFTVTDFEVYVYANETPLYTNKAYIYISGEFNKSSSMNLSFYCYDASGNHLKTFTDTMYSYNFMEYGDEPQCLFSFDVPDVTAFIEVGTSYPASWTNTYFYCKYMNVYSDDGRALGIPDMLLPVYEKCGWHGPVEMYALDGRVIEVPYCDVAAYQRVGWYLWTDYNYNNFVASYNVCISRGDYAAAFDLIEAYMSDFTGTYYEASIHSYKTSLMDAWRKQTNGPLAYCSHTVDKSNGNISITLRNVSYKYINAFKVQFSCYDAFGTYINDYYAYYYVDDAKLPSSKSSTYYWDCTPYNTDYIRDIRVTQVVYSDGVSWYR